MDVSLTNIICVATVAFSLIGFQTPGIAERFMHIPYVEKRHSEFFRLVTHSFLHADFTHLLFNMLAMYTFGNQIEGVFRQKLDNGVLMFGLLYFIGVIIAALPSYFKHQNNIGYRSLGASGGTSAIMFSYIFFAPWNTIYVYFIPVPALIAGIAFLVYSSWAGRRGQDNVAHDAHFWGAVFGLLFTIVLFLGDLPYFIDKIMAGPNF
jgi:membrane associated rhomboid family serine protease